MTLSDVATAWDSNVSYSSFLDGVGAFSGLLVVAVGVGIFFAVLRWAIKLAISPAERL